MSIEIVIWVWLPMLLGAVVLGVSATCAWKAFSPFQCVAGLLVLVSVAWSEMVLFAIARGAWPSFLPHIVIALMLVVTVGQVVVAIENAE